MHNVIALALILVCLACIGFAFRRPNVLTIYLGTLSLFTLGYYGLPALLIERSTLRYLPEADASATIFMALWFFVPLVCGVIYAGTRANKLPTMRLTGLDNLLEKHWWVGAIISNGVILYYNTSRALTFYQVENIDDFLSDRSIFSGIIAFFASFSQAIAAVYFSKALTTRNWAKILFAFACLGLQLMTVMGGGQRLLFLTPLLLIFAAIVAQRNFRLAGLALASAVGALLVVSPVMVAMRAGAWNSEQDIAAENFTYGADPVDTVLQSIVERGDILQNTALLKAYVDANGHVGARYYLSVLVLPVPRFLYRDKPYLMSDNGRMEGEASILAWRLAMGNSTGSLTAFGGIVAYREGGWAWVFVNGLLSGLLFGSLLTIFARSGFIGQAFFAIGLASWSVRKVPPSFFEGMADVMTYLPVILLLYALNWLATLWNRPVRAARPPGALRVAHQD